MERATIRAAVGGYIVEVRWPYGGSVMGNGEIVCPTFDEAVTHLARHLNIPELGIGQKIKCEVTK
jgi:hypothetical protein